MKSLFPYLILIVFCCLSCGEDLEEISIEIIPNDEIETVMFSGTVLSNDIIYVLDDIGQFSQESIAEAEIKVFRESELLDELVSNSDGSYELSIRFDPIDESDIFIQTTKDGYIPSIIPINKETSSELNHYIDKTAEDPELFLELDVDEVIIKGEIVYQDNFYVEVAGKHLNGVGGWKRVRYFDAKDGMFELAVPRNKNVRINFLNDLKCSASLLDGPFETQFSTDTDLGLLLQIEMVPVELITLDVDDLAECLKNSDLILNDQLINLEEVNELFSCSSTSDFRTMIINYQNSTVSEVSNVGVVELAGLSFTKCNNYPHEFTLTTDFGTYTHESDNLKIVQHRFTNTPVGFRGIRFFLEFIIEEDWAFYMESISFPNGSFSPGPARLLPLNQEIDGYTTFSSADEISGFEIMNGFFSGSMTVHEEIDNQQKLDFTIDFKVPVIE